MKRLTFLVALLCLLTTVSLTAQQNSFFIGANGGLNLSQLKYTEDLKEIYSTSNSLTGINGGVLLGMEINNFTLTSGVQYVQKGGEYQTENFEDEIGVGYFTAREKLHFLSVPILLGYRKYVGDKVGLTIAMGPSLNFGINGKIDEEIEYFGSDQVDIQHFDVSFGKGVNNDYKKTQVGFQISPGLIFRLNDKSKLHLNVTWDIGTSDSFNGRYKDANDFFWNNSGDQTNRSTLFTVGYEYHFSFGDKY